MKNILLKKTFNFSYFPLLLTFLFSSSLLSAQIVLSTDDTKNGRRTINCSGGSQTFTDDNSGSGGNYFDDEARIDTIILCPTSPSFQVKVSFSSFDVSSTDVLYVYDGDIIENPGAMRSSASGSGPSNAFGSWVQANCDPAFNPTGCLTFVFDTNGDRNKGAGWQASVSCESSSVTVECPSNVSVTTNCNNIDGMVSVTIPKPIFRTCGGASTSMVSITSSCSAITSGPVLADGGTLGTFTIPLGSYSITATSIADPTKTCTYFVYADQPAITCNDNVTSTIGFGCSATVFVDDVLENPCVGAAITYRIEVDLGAKGGGKATKTVNGSSLSSLNSNGLSIPSSDFNCGSEYPVTITRIISLSSSCGGSNSLEKSCTGRVRFVDNSAPIIQLTAPTLVTCGELTDAQIKSQLNIVVTDNCDVRDTTVSIGTFPSSFCASNLSVPVTITAVDFCGNSNTETFNVAITRPTNFFQPADTLLPCGAGTDPEITGFPLLDTDGDGNGDLSIMHNTCNFIPTYTDQDVTGNSNSRKIFRTWVITDWCSNAGPVTLPTQLIEVKDTGKPSVNCPSGNQKGTEDNPHVVFTNSNDCSATIRLTAPTGSDACGGKVTVSFNRAINIWDKDVYTNLNDDLPIGNYYAEYFGRDDTGNRSDTCKVYFNIQDGGIPTAICEDELNVSFVNNTATVTVSDIDVGSGDNCSTVTKEIRKEGGQWGQTVSLTCDELTTSAKVYLRIRDGNGGENTCWTTIKAKDATPPNCGDLSDQTIACEDFHADQFGVSTDANDNNSFDDNEWQTLTGDLLNDYNQAFGNPNCSDNLACGAPSIEQEYQLVMAQCGQTEIKRRFRATDGGTNQSSWGEQLITLTFEQDFSVSFPADWEGNCGDNFPTPNLNIDAQGCNVLAWTSEDRRFDGVNDACYYIERTYSVTNWCLYTAGDDAFTVARTEDQSGFSTTGATATHLTVADNGLFEYIQILRVSDNTIPTITVATVDDCINGTGCTASKTFSITADDCLGTEGLTYSYELWNGGILVKNGTTTSFSETVSNTTYEVKWSVQDNCGNTAWETVNYTFKDCKKPTPICQSGVTTTKGSDGSPAVLWATDINQKSEDNCSTEDNLEYRIWHISLGGSGTEPQNGAASSVILDLPKNISFDCDFIGTQSINFYVVDEAGNWDFCIVDVTIQDNFNSCNTGNIDLGDVAMVSGGIISASGIPLSNVQLNANAGVLFEETFSSNEDGVFEMDLPKGLSYVLSFDKEDDMKNGLSVFDVILVSKHILGITPFDSPYKYIAADMNNSGSVSAFDMVQMRKIILGIDVDLSDVPTWRFLSADYTFDGGFPTGEAIGNALIVPVITENLTELDFIGVKTGDIDGNVKVDGFSAAEPRNENKKITINVKDQALKKGEHFTVDFTLENGQKIQGLQYELAFKNLSLETIKDGLITATHVNQKSAHTLAVCWDVFSVNPSTQNTEGQLFQLQFVANQNGQLSDLLSLATNNYSEAVTAEEEVINVALSFEKLATNNDIVLHQNTPNPFAQSTIIGFDMPEKGYGELAIYNLQGALLHTTNGTFEKGLNQIELKSSDLAASGVLLYQLKTAEGVVSKKMILVD